jgi:hypothetical protein
VAVVVSGRRTVPRCRCSEQNPPPSSDHLGARHVYGRNARREATAR